MKNNHRIVAWVIPTALLAGVSCTTVPAGTGGAGSTSGNTSSASGTTTGGSTSTNATTDASSTSTTTSSGMGGMGGMGATSGSTTTASSSADSSSASTTAASTTTSTTASSTSSGMMPECVNSTDCASGLICNALGTCQPAVLLGNVATQGPGTAAGAYQLVDAGLGNGFACGTNFCLSGGIVR